MNFKVTEHRINTIILKRLIKMYGTNRSLGNILDNENAILHSITEKK